VSRSAAERLRALCLSLPEATEKVAWGEPTFRVGNGRMFATLASASTHHGDGRDTAWCAAPAGAQRALVEAAPDRFFVPPYVGKNGWIGIVLDRVDDTELELHLAEAWRCVAPARLRDRVDPD
jgi:hypothetical protein